MSPSRGSSFCAPSARTTLLMVAMLVDRAALSRRPAFLPVSALPEVDYPTIQVFDVLSRRKPGG